MLRKPASVISIPLLPALPDGSIGSARGLPLQSSSFPSGHTARFIDNLVWKRWILPVFLHNHPNIWLHLRVINTGIAFIISRLDIFGTNLLMISRPSTQLNPIDHTCSSKTVRTHRNPSSRSTIVTAVRITVVESIVIRTIRMSNKKIGSVIKWEIPTHIVTRIVVI